MQEDFHYYATYCASYIAGFSHEESMAICYSAQFVDLCSKTLIKKAGGPLSAATTQLQLELMDARTDSLGLQDITRIWSSFHFLPADLYAKVKGGKRYRNKFRLICGPNGELAADTVDLAYGKSLQAIGIAMHVIADTWAHRYFAGTPSLVINNTNYHFFEILDQEGEITERRIKFRHDPKSPDDVIQGDYTNSVYQASENNIMNLGHGRAGHLPDYSFIRYRYLPAWGNYMEIIKDNPSDYMHAFCQMVCALRFLRKGLVSGSEEASSVSGSDEASSVSGSEEASSVSGSEEASSVSGSEEASSVSGSGKAHSAVRTDVGNASAAVPVSENASAVSPVSESASAAASGSEDFSVAEENAEKKISFPTDTYDFDSVSPWKEEIQSIICKRQPDACADWKALGEKLSGKVIEDFDQNKYLQAYIDAPEELKTDTFLGRFFLAAMAQKSMVTNKIFSSGNILAGVSVNFRKKGFKGIKDFADLVEESAKGSIKDYR